MAMNTISLTTWYKMLTPEQKRAAASAIGTSGNVLTQIALGHCGLSLARAIELSKASYQPDILARAGAPLTIESFEGHSGPQPTPKRATRKAPRGNMEETPCNTHL